MHTCASFLMCTHVIYIYLYFLFSYNIHCIGEHMWYIHINMCFHFLITYTPCKRIKISANVFDRHLCALCGIVAYVQMFHTYMHLYVELCVPLLLKRRARLSHVDLIVITLEKWLLKFQESLTKNMERITRKYAGMSMSVCFEFTPVSNIIPKFATLGLYKRR